MDDTEIMISCPLEKKIVEVSRSLYAIRDNLHVPLKDLRTLQDQVDALRQLLMYAVDSAS